MSPIEQKRKSVSSIFIPSLFIYFIITDWYMLYFLVDEKPKLSNHSIITNVILIGLTFFLPKRLSKKYKPNNYKNQALYTSYVIGFLAIIVLFSGTIPLNMMTEREWYANYFNLFFVINIVQAHKYIKKHNSDQI